MVRYVKDFAEFEAIQREAGNKLVVVDFTAAWCPPCRMIGPFFEALSEKPEYQNVVFLKVDVDEAQELSARLKVRAMPTFMFFKNGEKLEEFTGADRQKLTETLNSLK